MTDTNQTPAQPAAVVTPGTATSLQFNYFFKTDKIRDDEGKVIGAGRKHPDVKAVLPVPTYAELIAFLQSAGKEAELILEAVTGMIDSAGRAQIQDWRENNAPEATFTATNFDLNKLTLTAISNTPRGERGGAAISDEDWTAMLDDYHHVMTQVVGYEEKKVKLAIMHFKVQLRRIKNDKPAVQKLLDLLNVWASKTENLEDHTACYEDLTKRAAKYLKAEEKNVAEAL
jgi:hypothetical protein